jgi:hypothetical protein
VQLAVACIGGSILSQPQLHANSDDTQEPLLQQSTTLLQDVVLFAPGAAVSALSGAGLPARQAGGGSQYRSLPNTVNAAEALIETERLIRLQLISSMQRPTEQVVVMPSGECSRSLSTNIGQCLPFCSAAGSQDCWHMAEGDATQRLQAGSKM